MALVAQEASSLADLQGCAHGPLGIVAVGGGNSEQCHDAIVERPFNRAAIALDDAPRQVVKAIRYQARLLRVAFELARIVHLACHDCDLADFRASAGLGYWGPVLVTMRAGVGSRRAEARVRRWS